MIAIRAVSELDQDDLHRLVVGYVSHEKYEVRRVEAEGRLAIELELVPLPQPVQKRFDHLDAEEIARFRHIAAQGFTFAAFDGDQCVGIVLAKPSDWNKSLWVWEMHVAESYRLRGIGRRLMDAAAARATAAGMRIIVCETQNTNVPAIRFYSSCGYQVEGIDLSYYSNEDYPDGEIAIFMKKKLAPLGG